MACSDADAGYNLSEVESIDSDWLDLSSRDESVGDGESDGEIASRPLSRQSSIGEHGGWEGIIESTDDEALLDGGESESSAMSGTVRVRPALHRDVEDLRERQALEQSMVSTLTGSRGDSLDASARDLRLSFPDPLTSPPDELVSLPDRDEPEPRVAAAEARQDFELGVLQIALYGDAREGKHVMTRMVLGKLAQGLHLELSGPDIVGRYTLGASVTVHVSDNTGVFDPQSVSDSDARPSLAIVFLPALLKTLPRHSLYLPIAEIDNIATDALHADSDRQWNALDIPSSQLLLWHVDTPSPAFSTKEISALDPAEVALGFEPLLPHRSRALQTIRDQVASAPAVTLITLLSIILGYIVASSSSFNASVTSVSPFVANTSCSSVVPSPLPIVFNASRALASAPLSSLSTIAPLRNSLAAVSLALTPTSASSKVLSASSILLNPTSTCIVPGYCLPSTSSLAVTTQTPTRALAVVPSIIKSLMAAPSSDKSARGAEGLSELLKPHGKGKAVEGHELIGALDELQRAISGQASTLLSPLSSLSAHTVQERLRARNDRAHDRARRMRKRGQDALREAHGRAWGRVELARQRAREIHSKIGEEAASIVEGVQRRWEERVQEREAGRAERVERRRVHDWSDWIAAH